MACARLQHHRVWRRREPCCSSTALNRRAKIFPTIFHSRLTALTAPDLTHSVPPPHAMSLQEAAACLMYLCNTPPHHGMKRTREEMEEIFSNTFDDGGEPVEREASPSMSPLLLPETSSAFKPVKEDKTSRSEWDPGGDAGRCRGRGAQRRGCSGGTPDFCSAVFFSPRGLPLPRGRALGAWGSGVISLSTAGSLWAHTHGCDVGVRVGLP